eukprot:TRINITY_DN19087_c0_g1_i1.p1 TRINITY_DN19087_c0_g1~~TRINITY_DN19087_c0_g1_i1.p1  ORF type:complete len:231 (+),score=65.62 TRINITY_DN19087_c0_g1_i1:462-1154(+)
MTEAEAIESQSHRRYGLKDQQEYHLKTNPPPEGMEVVWRDCHRPEAIKPRLIAYKRSLKGMNAVASKYGIPVSTIDCGSGLPERLHAAAEEALYGHLPRYSPKVPVYLRLYAPPSREGEEDSAPPSPMSPTSTVITYTDKDLHQSDLAPALSDPSPTASNTSEPEPSPSVGRKKTKSLLRKVMEKHRPSTALAKNKKLSLIHISEPTRLLSISYAVFCLKKKKNDDRRKR